MAAKRGSGVAEGAAERESPLPVRKGRVLAAEFHAFRHPVASWPVLLERVRELGATHVSTLLPWSEVEPNPDDVELGGRRPQMDVDAFLDRVADAGLRAIVRIGPRVRADLALAGLPDHVVHDRAVMARSPRGNGVPSPMPPRMFPWPSYASVAYRAHVRRFVDTIMPVLLLRLAPSGIVDAIDIEDPSAVLVRAGAYARDYHPDAVEAFRRFLAGRYPSIEALSSAWGIAESSFDDVVPPTRFAANSPRDLPRHLDWAAFQEWLVDDFRGFLADAIAGASGGAVTLSSALDANASALPTDAGRASRRIARVGAELATRASEVVSIRRRLSPVAIATDRPFARLLVGDSPWGRSRRESDVVASAFVAVAMGAREIELSMAVAHERWWGAPIEGDGRPASSFEAIRALTRSLEALGVESLSSKREVVVVVPPEYARFVRVTHLFGPFGAGLLDFAGRSFAEATLDSTFGFERSIQHAFLDRLAAIETALDETNLDFSFADPDSVRALEDAPKLAFVPSFETLDETTCATLDELVARGTVVVIGPDRPHLGRSMDPVNVGLAGTQLLPEMAHADFVERVRAIAASAGVERLPHDPDSSARAYVLRRGAAIAGYVLSNPGATLGRISLGGEGLLVDPITDETFGPTSSVPVIARSARLLLPRHDSPTPAGGSR